MKDLLDTMKDINTELQGLNTALDAMEGEKCSKEEAKKAGLIVGKDYVEVKKMKKYYIQDREAGNKIVSLSNEDEAISCLIAYEKSDREEGIYQENFYEIMEIEE